MKQILIAFLILLIPTQVVFAAPQFDVSIELIQVRNDYNGSVLFVFRVSGGVPKADLHNGYVKVQGGDVYGLHCNQVDNETVQCSTSKKVSEKNVTISFSGHIFWDFVPQAQRHPDPQCYNVYDWDGNDFATFWVLYGTHCQDFPPEEGEVINWVNPSLYPPYIYMFTSDDKPNWCSWTGLGPGYYYHTCPD